MEVYHQPAFFSGGGSAENPGENSISIKIRHILFFCEFFFGGVMSFLVLEHNLILKLMMIYCQLS